MMETRCSRTGFQTVSLSPDLLRFYLLYRVASDHGHRPFSSRMQYNPQDHKYSRPAGYAEYQQYQQNKFKPYYDKAKLKEWEEIINTTPIYLPKTKYFIMKSQDSKSV